MIKLIFVLSVFCVCATGNKSFLFKQKYNNKKIYKIKIWKETKGLPPFQKKLIKVMETFPTFRCNNKRKY